MAQEIRRFSVTIPAGTLQSANFKADLSFPSRLVRELEVRIPPGPRGELAFAIGAAGRAVLPTQTGQFIVTDDEVIHWPLEDMHDSGSWTLFGFNTGQFDHTIEVRFLLDLPQRAPAASAPLGLAGAGLPGEVPQPALGPPPLPPPLPPPPPIPPLPPAPPAPMPPIPPTFQLPGSQPDLMEVSDRAQPVLVVQYGGREHVLWVDSGGLLQVRWQTPGGLAGAGGPWGSEDVSWATELVSAGRLQIVGYAGLAHVYAPRKDGKILHAAQALDGQPSWDWGGEIIGK